MSTKNLLGLRKKISAKRPEFIMQDHHKRPETQARWRKPKGMHSKMRHGVWGRPASVNVGYRGPAAVRGLHDSGLAQALVNTVNEVESLDGKTHGAIIGHVGGKRKIQLLEACKKKGITVLNVKNPEDKIKQLTGAVAARKEAKKEAAKRKEAKTKIAPKKVEKKEEAPTKEEQRKEMEKVITQREA